MFDVGCRSIFEEHHNLDTKRADREAPAWSEVVEIISCSPKKCVSVVNESWGDEGNSKQELDVVDYVKAAQYGDLNTVREGCDNRGLNASAKDHQQAS